MNSSGVCPASRDRSSLPVSGISKTTASSNGSRARGRTSRSTPSPRAHHFSQIPADFCGVRVDRAANLNGLLLSHQPRDGGANRADSILDGANLLLHRFLRLSLATGLTARLLAAK